MRLLVIIDSYPPHHSGGYELRCKDVLGRLQKRGHEVLIITTRCPTPKCSKHLDERMISRVLHKKSETPSIYSRIFHDFLDMRIVDKALKPFKPDIAYLWHLGDLSNAILPYFSNKKLPIVLDDGGLGLVFVAKLLEKGLYFYKNENDSRLKKRIKSLICYLINICSFGLINTKATWPSNLWFYFNSEYSMMYAHDNGVPVENSKVIHSGIDISRFQFKPRDVIGSPIRILTPGRISPEKGMKDSILLLSKLKEKCIPSTLTLIGKDYSTTYFMEILGEIEKQGLEKNVRVLPMVDHSEMAKLYRESDICFFPSYQKQGLSRVPLEAMANGCLVITYGNEGSNEIIKHGETGYIVPQRDINTSVDIIKELMLDKTIYWRIVQDARCYIEQNHSIETYVDKIEVFLGSILISSSSIGRT